MHNPWKLATIGMALTTVTALTAGLTTAYFVRPAATDAGAPGSVASPLVASAHAAIEVHAPGLLLVAIEAQRAERNGYPAGVAIRAAPRLGILDTIPISVRRAPLF